MASCKESIDGSKPAVIREPTKESTILVLTLGVNRSNSLRLDAPNTSVGIEAEQEDVLAIISMGFNNSLELLPECSFLIRRV